MRDAGLLDIPWCHGGRMEVREEPRGKRGCHSSQGEMSKPRQVDKDKAQESVADPHLSRTNDGTSFGEGNFSPGEQRETS